MVNRNTYTNEFKLKAVMESHQRDTSIEGARKKFNLSRSALNRWRSQFQKYAAGIFDKVKASTRKKPGNGHTPEEMQQMIGELTLENHALKKILESWD